MYNNNWGAPLLTITVVVCFAFGFPARADAFFIMQDSDGSYWSQSGDAPRHSLSSGEGKVAFEKIMDPTHLIFENLGIDGGHTLTVDQDGPKELFVLLGLAGSIPDGESSVPMFGYTSSRRGDTTVLLAHVDRCPAPCDRIFWIEVRRDAGGFSYAGSLRPTPGLSSAVTTCSGLRLGMTKNKAKAILGKPQHEEPDVLHYRAYQTVSLAREALQARGCREETAPEEQLVYRVVRITFKNGRADSIFVKHRITWD